MIKLYHFVILKQWNFILVLFLFLIGVSYVLANTTEKLKSQNEVMVSNVAYVTSKIGGDLKLGTVGSFNSFTPFSLVGVIPIDYYFLVYDSLMVESLDKPQFFQPLLAEKYRIQGNKVIFYLNKKATWSNREKITANDVIYTFEVITNFGAPYYKAKLQLVKNIKKINNYTIEFELDSFSDNLFNFIVSMPIIYKEENANFISPSLKIPVTSGAYFIEDYKQGNFVIFKRNQKYWAKDLPSRKGYFNFDRIYYRYVKTQNQLSRLYKVGDITFKKKASTDTLSKDDKVFLKTNNDIPIFKAYFLNTNGVLKDIQLREAVIMTYDFKKVKEYFLNKYQVRLQSLFENSSFKDKSFIFRNTANFVKAQNLIKDKKNIKLRFLFKSEEDFKISQDFINNLQSQGFIVSYKILPFYDYYAATKANKYDIIVENLVFAHFPQDELISYFTANGEYNYSHINDKKVQTLITNITSQGTRKEKERNLQALDLQLKKLYVYIPLYYEKEEEYLYKNWLAFNKRQTFSIYRWWHK